MHAEEKKENDEAKNKKLEGGGSLQREGEVTAVSRGTEGKQITVFITGAGT